jgi:hypothetical protein
MSENPVILIIVNEIRLIIIAALSWHSPRNDAIKTVD